MQQRDDIMSVDAMMDERYGKVGTPVRSVCASRYCSLWQSAENDLIYES